MLGWHFLKEDRRLRWGTQEVVEEGKIYSCDPKKELLLCEYGMHASRRLLDAFKYAPGPIVCRVDVTGDLVYESDKFVGRHREVIWMLDATNILHEFACRCAEDVLTFIKNPDPRSLAAIKAKRDWMQGKISDHDLRVAREAAWKVREAASGAAWAASDAAREGAWAAAWGAAWAAAWGAREAAAASTAEEVEWEVWEKQNRHLTAMICAAKRG